MGKANLDNVQLILKIWNFPKLKFSFAIFHFSYI